MRARTGSTRGTVAYMAPERFTRAPVDAAADIYGLGCTMYEGLVGRRLFPDPVPVELVQGTHLVVEGAVNHGCYYLEVPSDRRAVFLLPWGEHALLGTTETPYTGDPDKVSQYLKRSTTVDDFQTHTGAACFVLVSSRDPLDGSVVQELKHLEGVTAIKQLNPVLPILSTKDTRVPFITTEGMLAYNEGKNLSLWELAARYESMRGNISEEEVFSKMNEIRLILRDAVETGLKGTEFDDRILGPQSVKFKAMMEDKKLVDGEVLNRIIMYVSAIMEVKSSMGVIVAAPTAGSCGAMPGAVLGVADALGRKFYRLSLGGMRDEAEDLL